MKNTNSILQSYDSITLREMDKVKLMDRMDTKFTFSFDNLALILQKVKPFYKVLNINETLISRYQTLYYDNADLYLYNRHHAGQLNRYKVRHRTYVESNLGFLEVKFKNNKGRTLKQRINKMEAQNTWDGDSEEFLKLKTPFDPKTLVPILWINYNRLTLVNKINAERLTIDLNLEFKKDGKDQVFHNLVIAEVKQEGKYPSPFLQIMKEMHIREGSISKYCMGVALSIPNVKFNNFKSTLLTLKKIINI